MSLTDAKLTEELKVLQDEPFASRIVMVEDSINIYGKGLRYFGSFKVLTSTGVVFTRNVKDMQLYNCPADCKRFNYIEPLKLIEREDDRCMHPYLIFNISMQEYHGERDYYITDLSMIMLDEEGNFVESSYVNL